MGIRLPMYRTVLTASKGVFMCHHSQQKLKWRLSEGESVFSASARKDVVLKSLICKLLLQTESQTQTQEYLWSRSKSEKCEFCALCRVLSMHLTCTHSKQVTLQNFIANKKQDLSACRFCWPLHMCTSKYHGAACSGRWPVVRVPCPAPYQVLPIVMALWQLFTRKRGAYRTGFILWVDFKRDNIALRAVFYLGNFSFFFCNL